METILYVEDEQDIREIAAFALEDEFELIICKSGEEALEVAAASRPSILMLDVMMPGLDGPSTLKRLREHEHLATLPAIFMTAKVQPAEIAQYLASGAIGVISKPFDPMSLAEDIRHMLKESQQ